MRFLILMLCLQSAPLLSAPRVVTSIAALQEITAPLMAGVGVPQSIITEGASAHHFALRPSHMRLLQQADLVIWIDRHFEAGFGQLAHTLPRSTGQLELLLGMKERGVPLRTTVRGFSMYPFIKDKDVLTIAPLGDRQLRLGEVVAFRQTETGRLAIHRILKKTGTGWLVRGDNCPVSDGVVSPEKIIGRVIRIERGSHQIRLSLGPERIVIAFLNRGDGFLQNRGEARGCRAVVPLLMHPAAVGVSKDTGVPRGDGPACRVGEGPAAAVARPGGRAQAVG